ncbi:hypothetical protein GGI12_004939 [Dipsacomyces acuminosporus]|nr:hypothetical protein GGI12_004939 [Dipsacomyces acuminosporus]
MSPTTYFSKWQQKHKRRRNTDNTDDSSDYDSDSDMKERLSKIDMLKKIPAPIQVDESVPTQEYFIAGVKVRFPFKPYPSQLGMMSHMIRALTRAQNTMIESPTGSGKSLALLCAALAWKKQFTDKQKETMANVRQIVKRFARSNPLPKFDSATSDDKKMATNEDNPREEKPKEDKNRPDNEDDTTNRISNTCVDAPKSLVKMDSAISSETQSNPARSPNTLIKVLEDMDEALEDMDDVFEEMVSELEPAKQLSPKVLEDTALAYLPQTVSHILKIAEDTLPKGIKPQDIELLKEYEQSKPITNKLKIYFGTRTHKQVSQLVDELRKKTTYRPRSAVLGSRSQTCFNKHAMEAASVDDACRALVDTDSCRPYFHYRDLVGNRELMPGGRLEIWDLEDLVMLGKEVSGCPYFASRELASAADIVFCPYNYILDPGVRGAANIELDGSVVILDEAHNVENAAREAGSMEITDSQLNLLSIECERLIKYHVLVEEHRHFKTLADTLNLWIQSEDNTYEYQDYETRTAVWPNKEMTTEQLLNRLCLTPEIYSRLRVAYSTIEHYIKEQRKRKEKQKKDMHERKYQKQAKKERGQEGEEQEEEELIRWLSNGSLRLLSGFLRVLGYASPTSRFHDDYRIAIIRKPNPALLDANNRPNRRGYRNSKNASAAKIPPNINVLAFWSLNPGVVFSEIATQARSIILTSGTLSPLDSYASELQADFASTLETNHVIDPQRFFAASIACGPQGELFEGKYKNTELLCFQDDVGSAIGAIAARSPDGMLVFVPSYSLLNKLIARWEVTGQKSEIEVCKDIYIEPQRGTKKEFEKLLKEYRETLVKRRETSSPAPRGAIMFAVYRGKVSEGIDFTDYFCRTVINIGIPYPAFKDVKVILKREYNDTYSQSPPKSSTSLDCKSEIVNGNVWYDIQAFRAINQALGRCLRHRMDWGAIIMLESRFTHSWNVVKLSKWVRNYMRPYRDFRDAMNDLDAFYGARIQDDLIAELQDAGDSDGDDEPPSTASSTTTLAAAALASHIPSSEESGESIDKSAPAANVSTPDDAD